MRDRGSFYIPKWGSFTAIWERDKLLYLDLTAANQPSGRSTPRTAPPTANQDPFLREIERQVRAFLHGKLRRLDLPHILPVQPAFRHRLWREAQNIPYGEVVSYGMLAARAGNPRAPRAAGHAMSVNPLFLLVPCHRVIASKGKLGGYGGRPDLKVRLLTLEGLRVEEGRVWRE